MININNYLILGYYGTTYSFINDIIVLQNQEAPRKEMFQTTQTPPPPQLETWYSLYRSRWTTQRKTSRFP